MSFLELLRLIREEISSEDSEDTSLSSWSGLTVPDADAKSNHTALQLTGLTPDTNVGGGKKSNKRSACDMAKLPASNNKKSKSNDTDTPSPMETSLEQSQMPSLELSWQPVNTDDEKQRRGFGFKFSEDEDKRLEHLIADFKAKGITIDWDYVHKQVNPLRTKRSIQVHWDRLQKQRAPPTVVYDSSPYSPDEDRRLLQAVAVFRHQGLKTNWAFVRTQMGEHRDKESYRYRWNRLIKMHAGWNVPSSADGLGTSKKSIKQDQIP